MCFGVSNVVPFFEKFFVGFGRQILNQMNDVALRAGERVAFVLTHGGDSFQRRREFGLSIRRFGFPLRDICRRIYLARGRTPK